MQFRELEFLSGLKDPDVISRLRSATPGEQARLRRRLDEPSLWDAFVVALGAAGLPSGNENEVGEALLTVARDRASYGPSGTSRKGC